MDKRSVAQALEQGGETVSATVYRQKNCELKKLKMQKGKKKEKKKKITLAISTSK